MVRLEATEEVHAKAARLDRYLAPSAFRGWKVTLLLDSRAFDGTLPSRQLPGAGLGQHSGFLQMPEVRLEPGPVLNHRYHGKGKRAGFIGAKPARSGGTNDTR